MYTAIYIRVSTVGQNEAGQRAEIEKWLARYGVKDATFYVDKETGKHLDRPGFKAMQKAIFAGEVKCVVVWKLDRLARTIRDGINVLTDWLERGVRLVATSQQLDFSGATGKMVAGILFAVSEMEMELRRERQAAGIEQAKKAGIYTGRKPGTTKAKPSRARRLRDKGLTMDEIAQSLGVTRMTIWRYLQTV